MAAMFNREASFDDNRSDIYDDDEDRGFFQMNESDEGTVSILMWGKSGLSFYEVSYRPSYFDMQLVNPGCVYIVHLQNLLSFFTQASCRGFVSILLA